MKFSRLSLSGAYLIELEPRQDERGFFSRLYCQREFLAEGLSDGLVQVNDSFSRYRGTLRGLHYQLPPHRETKLVRCVRGAVWDVILDLRDESATFGQWLGRELTAENRAMMYVPKGFAHGFLTLTDDCELVYFVDEFYTPECERGIRWNDPFFKIDWPLLPEVISERDLAHPDYSPSHPDR